VVQVTCTELYKDVTSLFTFSVLRAVELAMLLSVFTSKVYVFGGGRKRYKVEENILSMFCL